jgi:hypothetical protein
MTENLKHAQGKIDAAVRLLGEAAEQKRKAAIAAKSVKISRKKRPKKVTAAKKQKSMRSLLAAQMRKVGSLRPQTFQSPAQQSEATATTQQPQFDFFKDLHRPRRKYVTSEWERQLSTLQFKQIGNELREMTYNIGRVLVDSKDTHVEVNVTEDYLPPNAPKAQFLAHA